MNLAGQQGSRQGLNKGNVLDGVDNFCPFQKMLPEENSLKIMGYDDNEQLALKLHN